MSDKQALLEAVRSLPEGANWTEITDALLDLLARRGAISDFARLYRARITPEQLAEYLNPTGDIPLDDVIAELDAGPLSPKRS